jgi:hypothetical protein
MWIVFYLFSVAACGYHQFTFIGGLNLVFLFSPSVDLSEGITREKYSQYSTYLLETPRFASIYVLGPLFAFIAASPYLIWLPFFLKLFNCGNHFFIKYIFRNIAKSLKFRCSKKVRNFLPIFHSFLTLLSSVKL